MKERQDPREDHPGFANWMLAVRFTTYAAFGLFFGSGLLLGSPPGWVVLVGGACITFWAVVVLRDLGGVGTSLAVRIQAWIRRFPFPGPKEDSQLPGLRRWNGVGWAVIGLGWLAGGIFLVVSGH